MQKVIILRYKTILRPDSRSISLPLHLMSMAAGALMRRVLWEILRELVIFDNI